MSGAEFRIAKKKAPVEIVCSDGAVLYGFLFISQQGRLSDTLNDSRRYLPFEDAFGDVAMLSKELILKTTPLNGAAKAGEPPAASGVTDPYKILGLRDEASPDDAMHARDALRARHGPDAILDLRLPDENMELARMHVARIDDAYDRIAKTLRPAKEDSGATAPRWSPLAKRVKDLKVTG